MHSPASSPPDGPSAIPSKRKSTGTGTTTTTTSSQPVQQSSQRLSGPDHKRPKFNSYPDQGVSRMSKVLGKRLEIVDLTRPPTAFQPHKGAKKLVIKNLRTTSQANDLAKYYDATKQELVEALQAIFEQKQPRQPLERLYRGVEDLCRHGVSKELYETLRERCETYIKNDVRRSIQAEAGSSNIDMLRSTYKHWVIWNAQSVSVMRCCQTPTNPNMLSDYNPFSIQLPRSIVSTEQQGLPANQRHGHNAVQTDSVRFFARLQPRCQDARWDV